MKQQYIISLLLFFFLNATSCRYNNGPASDLYGLWRVDQISDAQGNLLPEFVSLESGQHLFVGFQGGVINLKFNDQNQHLYYDLFGDYTQQDHTLRFTILEGDKSFLKYFACEEKEEKMDLILSSKQMIWKSNKYNWILKKY